MPTDDELRHQAAQLRELREKAKHLWPDRVRSVNWHENSCTVSIELKKPAASIYGRGKSFAGAYVAVKRVLEAVSPRAVATDKRVITDEEAHAVLIRYDRSISDLPVENLAECIADLRKAMQEVLDARP